MRLFAALLSGNGPAPGPKGLGQARAQAGLLEGALRVADEAMVGKGFGKPGDQAVFVAPEFWFSNSWVATDKFYSHDIKRWLVGSLARMAKEHPKILLVPGTVLWVKSKKDEQQVGKVEARFKAVKDYHDKTYGKLTQQDRFGGQYGVEDLAYYKKAQTNETGWSHHIPNPPTGQLPKDPGPVDYLKASDDILIGQNTAYICKGEKILKYHKIGNSAETQKYANNIVFAPGSIAGQFLVGTVRYGLEICMDHWLGILAESGKAKVDVQVVTSSTTPTQSFHLNTQKDAIFVHASNPPLQSGTALKFGETQVPFYQRVRAYPGLSLDLLIAENSGHKDCSPDDPLKPVEPQQDDGDLSGALPAVKHVQVLPPR
jgi:hypothetical protein